MRWPEHALANRRYPLQMVPHQALEPGSASGQDCFEKLGNSGCYCHCPSTRLHSPVCSSTLISVLFWTPTPKTMEIMEGSLVELGVPYSEVVCKGCVPKQCPLLNGPAKLFTLEATQKKDGRTLLQTLTPRLRPSTRKVGIHGLYLC